MIILNLFSLLNASKIKLFEVFFSYKKLSMLNFLLKDFIYNE